MGRNGLQHRRDDVRDDHVETAWDILSAPLADRDRDAVARRVLTRGVDGERVGVDGPDGRRAALRRGDREDARARSDIEDALSLERQRRKRLEALLSRWM